LVEAKTLKALANSSPGFALKPWDQRLVKILRNPEGVATCVASVVTDATLSGLGFD
jgi:hypothetical protein